MSKSIPPGTVPSTYPANVLIVSGNSSVEATTNVTVQLKTTSFTVSLSVTNSSYAKNSNVPITAKVMQGLDPALGASVQFTLVNPNGTITTKKVTADSSGQAVWNYRVSAKDPKGLYRVTAQATLGSQTAISSAVNFSIQ